MTATEIDGTTSPPDRSILSVCEHFSHHPLSTCDCLNLIPGLVPVICNHPAFNRYVVGAPSDQADWDESFDLIISTGCYQRYADLRHLSEEVFRLLKPGGFCYLAGCSLLASFFPSTEDSSGRRRTRRSLRRQLSDFWIHDYTPMIGQYPATFDRDMPGHRWYRSLLPERLRRRLNTAPGEFIWVLTKKR